MEDKSEQTEDSSLAHHKQVLQATSNSSTKTKQNICEWSSTRE